MNFHLKGILEAMILIKSQPTQINATNGHPVLRNGAELAHHKSWSQGRGAGSVGVVRQRAGGKVSVWEWQSGGWHLVTSYLCVMSQTRVASVCKSTYQGVA